MSIQRAKAESNLVIPLRRLLTEPDILVALSMPLMGRYARRQRHRRIGTVFELDSHEDHLVIADIFQIVNCEFALAYPAVPYLVGLVGPFDRRAILYMRASAAAGNRDPKVIQHVTMEAKALARGK